MTKTHDEKQGLTVEYSLAETQKVPRKREVFIHRFRLRHSSDLKQNGRIAKFINEKKPSRRTPSYGDRRTARAAVRRGSLDHGLPCIHASQFQSHPVQVMVFTVQEYLLVHRSLNHKSIAFVKEDRTLIISTDAQIDLFYDMRVPGPADESVEHQ